MGKMMMLLLLGAHDVKDVLTSKMVEKARTEMMRQIGDCMADGWHMREEERLTAHV